jgi:cytoskeleton protein RodZ
MSHARDYSHRRYEPKGKSMSDLGVRLREARELKGITLQQAEEVTHIRGGLLRALEEGRYQGLPGDVYGRGLVRNYARFLGVDADAAVREYMQHTGQPEVALPQVLDEPLAPPRRNNGWIVFLIVLAALLAVGWYAYSTLVVDRGLRVQSLWPLVVVTPIATPVSTLAASGEATPLLSPTPLPTDSITGLSPEAVPTVRPTATTIALPTRKPVVVANPTSIAGVYIEALAIADTYVEVTTDSERTYTGIMRPNDTAQWRADQTIVLRVGNAAGLQLLVNGVDVGTLGTSGQVINLEYTVGNLPGQ